MFSCRLANKQDKMNALLGSELIEILSLEKLVNQSRSLCHIVSVERKRLNHLQHLWGVGVEKQRGRPFYSLPQEPCSALLDLRRWSDRKTLRGLRWLLRAICLDYPELCARVAQDRKRPLEEREKEKNWKNEKVRRKTKGDRWELILSFNIFSFRQTSSPMKSTCLSFYC